MLSSRSCLVVNTVMRPDKNDPLKSPRRYKFSLQRELWLAALSLFCSCVQLKTYLRPDVSYDW